MSFLRRDSSTTARGGAALLLVLAALLELLAARARARIVRSHLGATAHDRRLRRLALLIERAQFDVRGESVVFQFGREHVDFLGGVLQLAIDGKFVVARLAKVCA